MLFATFVKFVAAALVSTSFVAVTVAVPLPPPNRLFEVRAPQGNGGGIFVPHPRPGHPVDTSAVFTPTATVGGGKVLKNPKVTAIRNPKKPGTP
ncbi:hypothetical protein JCM11491_006194 [Sporobolomyces phaffii]